MRSGSRRPTRPRTVPAQLSEAPLRCDQATKDAHLHPYPVDCHRSNLDGVSLPAQRTGGYQLDQRSDIDRRSGSWIPDHTPWTPTENLMSGTSSGGSPRPGPSVTMLAVAGLRSCWAETSPLRESVRSAQAVFSCIPVNDTEYIEGGWSRGLLPPAALLKPRLPGWETRTGRPVGSRVPRLHAIASCRDTARSGARTTPSPPRKAPRIFRNQ